MEEEECGAVVIFTVVFWEEDMYEEFAVLRLFVNVGFRTFEKFFLKGWANRMDWFEILHR